MSVCTVNLKLGQVKIKTNCGTQSGKACFGSMIECSDWGRLDWANHYQSKWDWRDRHSFTQSCKFVCPFT